MKNTLSKVERLSKKKLIEELFSKGSYFYLRPFKIYYLNDHSSESYHKLLISVPKKVLRKAVDRNRVKRRIREAYRLNKKELDTCQSLLIGIVYTSRKIEKYTLIESGVQKGMAQICSLNMSEKEV